MSESNFSPGSTPRQAALVLPLAIGAVVGKLGDDHLTGAIVLLVEPVLWVLVVYLVLFLIFSRQSLMAAAFLLSGSAGLALLHVPIGPRPSIEASPAQDSGPIPALRECIAQAPLSPVPVRLVQWTLDTGQEVALKSAEVARIQPDILLLSGLDQSQYAHEIADHFDGTALETPGRRAPRKNSLVVRGWLEDCGTAKTWWDLGSQEGLGPSLILALPQLAEAGLTPVLIVEVGMPESLKDLASWHRRVRLAGEKIYQIKRALGSEKLIVLGDFASPRSFKSLESRLLAAGLDEADVPASWPGHHALGPLPGLHRLDRVWFGSEWRHQGSARWTVDGQSRALLRSDLVPENLVPTLQVHSEASL